MTVKEILSLREVLQNTLHMSEAKHARRSRIVLARDEELGPRVRILQQSNESSAAIEGHPRNTSADVADPICLSELGRGAAEQALTLELIKLVGQCTILANGSAIVVAEIRSS